MKLRESGSFGEAPEIIDDNGGSLVCLGTSAEGGRYTRDVLRRIFADPKQLELLKKQITDAERK